MDITLLHPKLIHIPIALAVLMPLVTGGIVLSWFNGWLPRKAWFIAVALQAVLVLGGVAAIQTGEADEERVERVVSERYIEAHAEAGEAFTWGAGAVLALMLLGAALPTEVQARRAALVGVVGTVVVFGLGYRVGEAGGALVYEHGAASAWVGAKGKVVGEAGAGLPGGAGDEAGSDSDVDSDD